MAKNKIIIATRESPLAIRQSEEVKELILARYPHIRIEFLGITTKADKRLDVVLTEIGGKGLFVKELEEALMEGRADIAVHSMKDVPMDLPEGLIIPVVGARQDPRDGFVSNHYESYWDLPPGASIGTSSLRRQTQIRLLRPDLRLENLRGNMNTRLGRLDKGDFDAIILAAAGLNRLNASDRLRSYLTTEESLPSAGQGALGIECLASNTEILTYISHLHDQDSNDCVTAERAVCRRLNGGCKVPVAAYAELIDDELWLRGYVSNPDSSIILRAEIRGHRSQANELGITVANELLDQGAEAILSQFYAE